MTVQAMTWVLDHSPSEGSARLVLLALANHAGTDGADAYPSVETLRREARLKSRRTVQTALRALETAGAIEVQKEQGPQRSTRYRVVMGGAKYAPAQNMQGAIHDTGGAQSTTPEGAIDDSRVLSEPFKEPSKEPSGDIDVIWAYYQQQIPSRRQLDDKIRRQIRNARKVRSIDEIKGAIDGLARSPHHNGINDRAKKYLDLHYAIVPIGAESIEERIDKAIGWGQTNGDHRMDPAKRDRLLEAARYTWGLPHRPERARGEAARAELEACGYTIVELDRSPWLRIVA